MLPDQGKHPDIRGNHCIHPNRVQKVQIVRQLINFIVARKGIHRHIEPDTLFMAERHRTLQGFMIKIRLGSAHPEFLAGQIDGVRPISYRGLKAFPVASRREYFRTAGRLFCHHKEPTTDPRGKAAGTCPFLD